MNFEKVIKSNGLKATPSRLHLLELLHASTHPVSYEELKESLQMDKATFYRNVAAFESEGVIKSIESHDKRRYFELATAPHAHFICLTCNRVECIESTGMFLLRGYEIESITINGRCPQCQTQTTGAQP